MPIGSMNGYPQKQEVPRDGTFLRSLYDLFTDHPNTPMQFEADTRRERVKLRNAVELLRTFYGLEIVELHGAFRLVGEFVGDRYLDYSR